MTHEKLIDLLAELSLEEKIGQMALLHDSVCACCAKGATDAFGPLVEMNVSPEQIVLAGCFGCSTSPEPKAYAEMVRAMTAAHPHHIPPLMMRDVIHGFRTIFPLTLAVGCTFDEQYAQAMGRVSATEAAACELHMTLGPMMDVARAPVGQGAGNAQRIAGADGGHERGHRSRLPGRGSGSTRCTGHMRQAFRRIRLVPGGAGIRAGGRGPGGAVQRLSAAL